MLWPSMKGHVKRYLSRTSLRYAHNSLLYLRKTMFDQVKLHTTYTVNDFHQLNIIICIWLYIFMHMCMRCVLLYIEVTILYAYGIGVFLQMFNIYIKKAAEIYGVTQTRSIYEKSIEMLAEDQSRQMCIRFADLETKLGEIDRARALYAHCSQMCDPRVSRPNSALFSQILLVTQVHITHPTPPPRVNNCRLSVQNEVILIYSSKVVQV